MSTLRDKLANRLREIQEQARSITEQEDRSEATDAILADLLKEGETLQARAVELSRIESITGAAEAMAIPAARVEKRDDAPSGIGELFTRSEAFSRYQQAPMGTSAKVTVPVGMLTRAPQTTTSGTGQPWVSESRISIKTPMRQTPLLDLVQRVSVGSNSVEWITYPAAAPVAAVVAEGTPKPEATINASIATVTLDTIAHWAQATRQLLEDSGAARDFIEAELSRGVSDKIEAEIAAAITAATLPATAGADLMASIRLGVGVVQNAGFQPNAVVLNPADYAALDIDVFGKTLLGPAISGSFWGLRPVAVGAQPAGTALVGDFTAGVTYLERNSVSLYVTDSHASTFTSNIFTFLAEARGKGVVTRAEALVECTVTP